MRKLPTDPIGIKSLDDLRKYEAEIVRRIAAVPNGGNLFLLDPMRLLNDVSVALAPAVETAVRKLHPELPDGAADDVYKALAGAPRQSVRIQIEGLFRLPTKGARS